MNPQTALMILRLLDFAAIAAMIGAETARKIEVLAREQRDPTAAEWDELEEEFQTAYNSLMKDGPE